MKPGVNRIEVLAMRISVLLLLFLLPTTFGLGQEFNSNDDAYSTAFVKSAVQFMKTGGSTIEAKQYWNLMRLGDAVSIAVLKNYDRDELAQRPNASAYLTVVRNSFMDRSKVHDSSDREPKVTLFILGYLEEKYSGDKFILARIAYLRKCTADFSCSGLGERFFFAVEGLG